MIKIVFLVSCVLILTNSVPVAVFHGLGDFCLNPGMENFTKQLGEGVESYSRCVEIGNGPGTSFSDFLDQAQKACQSINEDDNFKGQEIDVVGLNKKKLIQYDIIIGLSQGALIARYIATDCEFGGSVRRMISIGGPQMGVDAVPHCGEGIFCAPLNYLIKTFVYMGVFQNNIGPAGYFRDPKNMDKYEEKSHFLADLNNERNPNVERKRRFAGLDKLMLVKFTHDTMIHPRETAWFQQRDEKHNLVNFEETELYKQDLIGLKQLHEQNKVIFVEVNGDHLRFSNNDVQNKFIPFLKE